KGATTPRFMSGTLQDPIGVSISGPDHLNRYEVGEYTYAANVTGGTAPYYFIWEERECDYNGSTPGALTCAGDYQVFDEGWGKSSTTAYFNPYITERWISVELRESPSVNYATGVGTVYVTGPAFVDWLLSGTSGNNGFKCENSSSWPFIGWHNGVEQEFRRNMCTGQRQWIDGTAS
ncbi:MAG TPA: hypothetical protein VFQ38_11640, partial [Longimicrobiales bacterium]|nr:hypothetical protein [Longimicrobiales bacterium]